MDQKRSLGSLVESLQPKMAPHGFSLRDNLFLRETQDRQEIVQPSALRKSQGRIGLLYGARVRFIALERLIHGDEAIRSHSGSYGGLSHLIAGKGYYDWTIDSPDALLGVSEAIFANIKLVAFPFFEKHASLHDMLQALDSHGRSLALSAEDQVVYRAAILWQLGRQPEARKILTDGLEERMDELPKKRIQIESFLRRLTGVT